jgi:hypothetical protein
MDGGFSSLLAVVPAIWGSPNGRNSRRISRPCGRQLPLFLMHAVKIELITNVFLVGLWRPPVVIANSWYAVVSCSVAQDGPACAHLPRPGTQAPAPAPGSTFRTPRCRMRARVRWEADSTWSVVGWSNPPPPPGACRLDLGQTGTKRGTACAGGAADKSNKSSNKRDRGQLWPSWGRPWVLA